MGNDRKVNFFIVGAVKGGTTALQNYLSQHEDVFFSTIKEPHYFSRDININNFSEKFKKQLKVDDGSNHQKFIRNEKEYIELFDKIENQNVIGEASASYLYSKVAAEEIYKYNPKAKILISLRHPVERAFSHFMMDKRVEGGENSFIEAIKRDQMIKPHAWGVSHLYLELGMYFEQVQRFLNFFPKENIHIIKHEDLKLQTNKVLQSICEFLDISVIDFDTNVKPNKSQLPRSRFLYKIANNFKLGNIFSESLKIKIREKFYTSSGLPTLLENEKEELAQHFVENMKKLNDLGLVNISNWYDETK